MAHACNSSTEDGDREAWGSWAAWAADRDYKQLREREIDRARSG